MADGDLDGAVTIPWLPEAKRRAEAARDAEGLNPSLKALNALHEAVSPERFLELVGALEDWSNDGAVLGLERDQARAERDEALAVIDKLYEDRAELHRGWTERAQKAEAERDRIWAELQELERELDEAQDRAEVAECNALERAQDLADARDERDAALKARENQAVLFRDHCAELVLARDEALAEVERLKARRCPGCDDIMPERCCL